MSTTNIPAENLYETATILVESVPDDEYESVHATLRYLYHSPKPISPETLREYAPCTLTTSEARNIVFELRTSDILSDDEMADDALRTVFASAALLAMEPERPTNTFVATLPKADDALSDVQFDPLLSGTVELIQSAEEDVVLMSPFLSEEGFERLQGALRTASGNGASISLITNSLTYGKEDYNRTFTRRLLGDDRLAPATTCYEYIDQDTWTTFHAKIITVDDRAAYLGTANLTHTGLTTNLELGVIFRDDTVQYLSQLVQALQRSRFISEVTAYDGSFHRR